MLIICFDESCWPINSSKIVLLAATTHLHVKILSMKFIHLSFGLLLYILSLLIFAHGIEETKFCSNRINKDVPKVYLTIDPISTVSWLGTITQRHLVLNWRWLYQLPNNTNNSTGLKGDWIGLFNSNVSSGASLKGRRTRWKSLSLKQLMCLMLTTVAYNTKCFIA